MQAVRCKLCNQAAAPGKVTCSNCEPTFAAWLRGKTRRRAASNRRRTARQTERHLPLWSLA
jgi:hypothetical protein